MISTDMPPENNSMPESERSETSWMKSPGVLIAAALIIIVILYILFSLISREDIPQDGVITIEEKQRILAELQTGPEVVLSEREKINILSDLQTQDSNTLSDGEKKKILDSLINI